MTARHILLSILVAPAIALLTISFWIPLFIYRPEPLERTDPRAWGIGDGRLVTIPSNGERLVGWWLRPRERDGAVLLILHGRSGNISSRAGIARRLAADGFGVLMVDYRGYGASSGRPSEHGLNEDAFAAYAWLEKQGVAPDRLILIGQSLGNAPAAALAVARPVAALVLVSPFTSLPDAAADRLALPPIRWLPWPRNRFDVADAVVRSRAPLLLVASASDGTVPLTNSRKLGSLVPGARWVRADRLGHNGLLAGVVADGSLTMALSALIAR